jgi:hypothetical protein
MLPDLATAFDDIDDAGPTGKIDVAPRLAEAPPNSAASGGGGRVPPALGGAFFQKPATLVEFKRSTTIRRWRAQPRTW